MKKFPVFLCVATVVFGLVGSSSAVQLTTPASPSLRPTSGISIDWDDKPAGAPVGRGLEAISDSNRVLKEPEADDVQEGAHKYFQIAGDAFAIADGEFDDAGASAPGPTTMLLFGAALVGLAALGRSLIRKRQAK